MRRWLWAAGTLVLPLCVFACSSGARQNDLNDYIGPVVRDRGAESLAATLPATMPATRIAAPQPTATGTLPLTVEQAILLSLENNNELAVQRLSPPIIRTREQVQEAAFDPTVSARVQQNRTYLPESARAGGAGNLVTDTTQVRAGIQKFFPTGTTVGVEGSTTYDNTDNGLFSDSAWQSRAGLTLSQALLQGFGSDVNLVSLRQARIDTRISEYELRGFVEALIAQVEQTYWDYALAQRQIEIVSDSLAVAQQQLDQTREMIRVGKLAAIELAAAEAEVAQRRESLINARALLERQRLQLLRLVNPPGASWEREIRIQNPPFVPAGPVAPVQEHVEVAMLLRPDLNEARLRVQRGNLEIVRTRNGLLPRLDLFIALGKTGYAGSFGDSVEDVVKGSGYDASAALAFDYALGNRAAEANYKASLLNRDQSLRAVDNLISLVQVDVRSAYVEVQRLREQIAATAATRVLQQETLRAEQQKLLVGKSTTLLVAQAQRDLLQAQIAEVQAVVNYLKSLVELYRLEGSLVQRRGILAPGSEPGPTLPQPPSPAVVPPLLQPPPPAPLPAPAVIPPR